MAEQGKTFGGSARCEVLDVSVSGDRAWTRGGAPERRRLTDSSKRALNRSIHADSKVLTAAHAGCASGVPEVSRPGSNG